MSLFKLLFLIAVVCAIWYGFKWLGRGPSARESGGDGRADGGTRSGSDEAVLAECPACKTYVPESLGKCPEGRSNCPMFGR